MAIRITGMNSGLDTESIITELLKAKSAKKDTLVKEQTKLEWKQDAWKELNTKVYSLYSKSLSDMRFQTDYYKKTTKVGNANAATVITGTNAVNGVQTLKINQLAKSGYLTGAELEKNNGKGYTLSSKLTDITGVPAATGEDGNSNYPIEINVSFGPKDAATSTKKITITADTTIQGLVTELQSAGLNASFDEKNQRFFVSSKSTGAANNFELTCQNTAVLEGLGLAETIETVDAAGNKTTKALAHKIDGQDAEIELNGAVFKSDKNIFEINGLTITANMETEEAFTLTTADDTDGIYDMIKNFLKEYNAVINEMDKLYNADSAKGYDPLTDEEKEAMTETEIEKWEEKIKASLLRKDSTLSTVSSAMKTIMMQGVKMSDGSQMYLSHFGISTLGYFNSADNEKNAYHIDGDPDDTSTSDNADKLKTAIANNPQQVVEFFSTLAKNLYGKLGDLMKKTDYSSSFTLYDDIAMKEEYDDYKDKITAQEEKISEYEDRYYKKFSAMETALSKLTSKESAISGLFG